MSHVQLRLIDDPIKVIEDLLNPIEEEFYYRKDQNPLLSAR